jgi:hypothetical protein
MSYQIFSYHWGRSTSWLLTRTLSRPARRTDELTRTLTEDTTVVVVVPAKVCHTPTIVEQQYVPTGSPNVQVYTMNT